MSRVILVRHGQARTGAQDEASYDDLSPLGRDQAGWLGAYLAGTSHGVARIWSGDLNRQRDTARCVSESLGLPVTVDPRLNELDYFDLAEGLRESDDETLPTSRQEFIAHFPQVMAAWAEGRIHSRGESFDSFASRVHDVLSDAEASDGTMLVTSGGIIGMALRHVLGLDLGAFSHLILQTWNTSIHRYEVEFGERRLLTFNAVPHLDLPGREAARTYV